MTIRYYNVHASKSTVSATFELPIAPYGVSDSATTILIPFKAVRIRKIEMWCNYRPNEGVAGNTINLNIVERRQARPIEWSDTATFLSPAHICKKFSKFDPLGLWYITTNSQENPEVTLQMPYESVCDITFDYIVQDGESCGTSVGSSLAYPKVYTNRINTNLAPVGRSYTTVITM
jgi:hypothetical protein